MNKLKKSTYEFIIPFLVMTLGDINNIEIGITIRYNMNDKGWIWK